MGMSLYPMPDACILFTSLRFSYDAFHGVRSQFYGT